MPPDLRSRAFRRGSQHDFREPGFRPTASGAGSAGAEISAAASATASAVAQFPSPSQLHLQPGFCRGGFFSCFTGLGAGLLGRFHPAVGKFQHGALMNQPMQIHDDRRLLRRGFGRGGFGGFAGAGGGFAFGHRRGGRREFPRRELSPPSASARALRSISSACISRCR